MLKQALIDFLQRRHKFTEGDVRSLELWLSALLLWWLFWIMLLYFRGGHLGNKYLALYVFLTLTVYWSVYFSLTAILALAGFYTSLFGRHHTRKIVNLAHASYWFFHFFLFFPGDTLPVAPVFSFANAIASMWCYVKVSSHIMEELTGGSE